jgi:hypothetical protein
MTIALIDNGSLEPDAHRNLRAVASAISEQTGEVVHAVSWKHSNRIAVEQLDGVPASALAPWIRMHLARGDRAFLFLPFFISEQGAIGSALRSDLEALKKSEGSFDYAFTPGLNASGTILQIAIERIRQAAKSLSHPAVIVVDHGGPSPASATLRNRLAAAIAPAVAGLTRTVAAASMESPEGDAYAFNRPLLADLLQTVEFNSGDVLIAPLFLSPGRHAGPTGDLRQIADAAQAAQPGLHCTFCELIGTHPLAAEALASELRKFQRTTSNL